MSYNAIPSRKTALAQPAPLMLEEIVVTAQKRTESVQDISATVNVVTGENLEKFQSFSFEDIEQQTAGLSLDRPNARSSNISMRGISTDPEAGTASAVDVYWNDMNVRFDIAFSQLYDLERLEILRGPQGTLQGRTSPAGAINIITRKPDLYETDGYVSAIISDNDGGNIWTGRQKPPRAIAGEDKLVQRPTLGDTDNIALGKTDDFGDLEFDILNLNLSWGITDNLELVAVTGYSDSDKLSRTENDRANFVTNPDAATWQRSNTVVESISQEIRLSSSGNDFWDYMVGVYYQDQETDTSFLANTTLRPPAPEISFYSQGVIPVDSEETGVFTFNTFYLSAVVQLEVGLRWAKYDAFRRADVFYGDLNYLPPALEPIRDTVSDGIAASFPIQGVGEENESSDEDAVTGSLKVRWDVSDNTSLYASYNRGYRPSGISIIPSPNIQFLPNGEDDLLHDEEESDALELGFKSRLWDGRATLNGAVYYQQFNGLFGFQRGLQVLDDTGQPVDIPGGIVYNGDANIWGAELEGQVLLGESWQAGGSVSYAKGEWDGATAPCNDREPGEVIGECDIDGEPVSGEPEFSLSLNSEFFVPLENTEWYIRGLYKYTGERDNMNASAGIGDVRSEFDDTHLLSLYTGFRSQSYSWDVSLWAKNLLDEDALTLQEGSDQYDLAFSGGSYTKIGNVGERVIGITARYNF